MLQCSALNGVGVDALWAEVERWVAERRASGEFDARRRRQATAWMWDLVQARLMASFRHHAAVRAALPDTLAAVGDQREAATAAARRLLDLYSNDPDGV